MVKDAYTKILSNKQRILIVFAHPDDAELYCGGTIARLVHDQKSVRLVKMTNGDKGSRQEKISQAKLGKIREQEDRIAAKVLGIRPENNIYLRIEDGSIENNKAYIGKIALQIRLFKPDVIITHNPEHVIIRFAKDVNWVNHRDHRNTGLVTVDAAYPYSRDVLFFPEHFQDKFAESHKVTEFLFVDYYDHPDLVQIDITDFVDTRVKAHASHSSQYTLEHAQNSADFFTKHPDGRRYERFRYVVAD